MPTFDLGGFFGGIIGTIGAFGVAFYTLKAQNKKEIPKIKREKYLLYQQINGIINMMSWEFLLSDEKLKELKIKMISYVQRLQEHVPSTIEHGETLTRELLQLIDDISEIGKKSRPTNDPEQLIIEVTDLVTKYNMHFEKQMLKLLPKPEFEL